MIIPRLLSKFFAACVLCLLVLLVGCAQPELQKKLVRLEKGLSDIREIQAEQTTKISEVDSRMRELSGKLEELEFSQGKKLGTDLNALKEDLTTLKRRVPPPQVVPVELLDSDEQQIARWPQELATLVQSAFGKIREAGFREALDDLEEAESLARDTDYHAVVLFWQGISYEGLTQWKEALQRYHQVVSQYKKSERAPLALYREASVLVKLEDVRAARVTLQKLISDYPKSTEVARAKDRLRDLR